MCKKLFSSLESPMKQLAALKLTIAPLSSTAGISLQNCHKISVVFEQFIYYILLNYTLTLYMNMVSFIYLRNVYSAYTVSKWRTIFKY